MPFTPTTEARTAAAAAALLVHGVLGIGVASSTQAPGRPFAPPPRSEAKLQVFLPPVPMHAPPDVREAAAPARTRSAPAQAIVTETTPDPTASSDDPPPVPGDAPVAAAVAAAPASAPAQAAAPEDPTVAPADYLRNPLPAYPSMSRRLREQGKVLVAADVRADGSVKSAAVETSSGFPRLDEAAVAAVRTWTFVPGTRGGVPVASRVVIPLRFELE